MGALELPPLDRIASLPAAARADIAALLASRLGAAWAPRRDLAGELGLPALTHTPTGVAFVVLPGGRFDMGLREADVEELARVAAIAGRVERTVRALESRARPVHAVGVRAFAVALRPLSGDQVRAISNGALRGDQLRRADAVDLARSLGFRLPSEAELEWIARDGGEHAFVADGARRWKAEGDFPTVGRTGVDRLTLGEWAADDWHDSYDGAPSDSRPWMNGDPRGVRRGALPFGIDQSAEELVLGLAAYRAPGRPPESSADDARMTARLAIDLPLD